MGGFFPFITKGEFDVFIMGSVFDGGVYNSPFVATFLDMGEESSPFGRGRSGGEVEGFFDGFEHGVNPYLVDGYRLTRKEGLCPVESGVFFTGMGGMGYFIVLRGYLWRGWGRSGGRFRCRGY